MRPPVHVSYRQSIVLFLLLAVFSMEVHAAISNAGILDNVLARYSAAASTWRTVIVDHATWLFWTLALISMVWTFGMLALRKADVGEFFSEFIRFTVFTGFFWWLLTNGPSFAVDIMNSLRQVGAQATGLGNSLSPSGIVDVGFDIFFKVVDQSSIWSPVDSTIGFFLSAIILIVFALVGVNMLILLISGWILAYAGVFFLGFGGSRWTSEMAIGYFKSVLNIAGQLFTLVLIVGIGKSFIDQYYTAMSSGMKLKELGVMLVVATIMLALVKTIPGLIGGLAGGNTGSLGSGFGAGAALAAASIGAAAIATAGSALMTGASSIAGGAQALMAAFSKASAAESAGGGAASPTPASGGETANAGGSYGGGAGSSPLASAMGDSGASSSASPGASASSYSATASSASSSEALTRAQSSTVSGVESTSGTDDEGAVTSSPTEQAANSKSDSNSSIGPNTSGTGTPAQPQDATAQSSGSPTGSEAGGSSSPQNAESAGDKATPRRTQSGGTMAAAAAMAAKAGRLARGTAAHLAQGSWDVAKAAAAEMKESAKDRIDGTVGGKIAAAIKAQEPVAKHGGVAATFGNDSLSAGAERADPESEIAAFRDGKPTTT